MADWKSTSPLPTPSAVQPDNDQTRGKIAQIGYLLQVTEEK